MPRLSHPNFAVLPKKLPWCAHVYESSEVRQRPPQDPMKLSPIRSSERIAAYGNLDASSFLI